jgi:gamma-glutamylcyclotransferase (GGCT)/AIG2-like uncharacterized protein YtfP
MTLYFAYGANMEQDGMRKRCPSAVALGAATLIGFRYVIARGFGIVAPQPGARVHGVLWKLTPRDYAALNAFESLDSGLYRRAQITVEGPDGPCRAMIYRARRGGRRRATPGYQERVVAAATDWRLPARYVEELRRHVPGYRGSRAAETGEIA